MEGAILEEVLARTIVRRGTGILYLDTAAKEFCLLKRQLYSPLNEEKIFSEVFCFSRFFCVCVWLFLREKEVYLFTSVLIFSPI